MVLTEKDIEAIVTRQLVLDDKLLEKLDKATAREIASRLHWFHAIDFKDFQSSGRFPAGQPQNITLYPVFDLIKDIDVAGMDCLDIGCWDGLVSFGLKIAGAASVASMDSVRQNTFLLARHLLDLDIEYFPGYQIRDMAMLFGDRKFDLIVCAGVLYHMLHPLTAFTACRRLIKNGGLFIIETASTQSHDDAVLVLNSETGVPLEEPFTYWVPTLKAVIGMAKLAGFDILGVRQLKAPHRTAVLGRAVLPQEVNNRTPLLNRIHELGFCDFDFNLKTLNLEDFEKSAIEYSGPGGIDVVDPATYSPRFLPHPIKLTDSVGKSHFLTASSFNLKSPQSKDWSNFLVHIRDRIYRLFNRLS